MAAPDKTARVQGVMERVGGAPITWGVDPSPGWGHLITSDRYLTELTACGLTITELGPDGFLPGDPDTLGEYLEGFGVEVVAGFVPALLYRPDMAEEVLDQVGKAAVQLAATGSEVIVLGPSADQMGYDDPVRLTEKDWKVFFANLERFCSLSEAHGLMTALHPHWGMAVAADREIDRVVENSSVGICLDTGHLELAGVDSVELARAVSERVIHVHLKDVDGELGRRVRTREMPFRQAVIDGVFRPLGSGTVDIAGVITALEASGYDGWYILEQDTSLESEPATGEGPAAEVKESLVHLEEVVAGLDDHQ